MKQIIFLSLLFFSLSFLTGCTEYSPYKVVMVKGKVLVDDKPLAGITVVFVPVQEGAGQGHAAGGVTDAEGNFLLTTGGLKYGKGAEVGNYNVTFSKGETKSNHSDAWFIPHLPTRYNTPQNSGIGPVKVVPNAKENNFTFTLTTEGLATEVSKIEKAHSRSSGPAPRGPSTGGPPPAP